VAFPAGIIGARIWYVIGEWHTFKDDLIRIFYIWEGGLAIMGGALLGIIVGVLFVKFKRKEISLLYTVDVVIPTILLAQAIGRWGNFFNQEVYGFKLANMDGYFFLPEFIKRNMFIEGSYRVPLFFFEGVVNVLGFFVLRYGIGEGLKKWKLPLDIAFGYATWYGLTRVVMEPLRDPLYNMGQNGSWSYIWGIVFAVAGILAIVINHLIHHFAKNKKVVAK
jgi:phosphatidylglycerol:prolipoprotein diacylglycerol transferase